MQASPIERAVAEHRAYLLRFAHRRVRDRALVEDVVHDTIVAALQGAAQFAGKASTRTWLTGILLRQIAEALRRERRVSPVAPAASAAHASDAAASDADAAPPDTLVDHHDPARLLEGRQSLRRLEHCLQQLPAGSARIMVLREIDGLSTDETARRLGVDAATVSSALYRARHRLRQCLSCG
jgi:RNA polymerase sigma-70 factor (ECF subfamily)